MGGARGIDREGWRGNLAISNRGVNFAYPLPPKTAQGGLYS